VFDLDGTLVDSRVAVAEAVAAGVREVYNRHGIDLSPDSAAIEKAMGLPPPVYFEAILPRKLHHLARQVQAACTDQEVLSLAEGRGRLFDGVTETLSALGDRGIALALVSNAQREYFRAAIRFLRLGKHFAHKQCIDEVPSSSASPKLALLFRALDVLEVDAAHAIMVGDRRSDVEAGKSLGCTTVALTYGFGKTDELAEADHRFDRFEQILSLFP
jgi:phosphoglycolate phosphatase-like HAD superfamily hydrolase